MCSGGIVQRRRVLLHLPFGGGGSFAQFLTSPPVSVECLRHHRRVPRYLHHESRYATTVSHMEDSTGNRDYTRSHTCHIRRSSGLLSRFHQPLLSQGYLGSYGNHSMGVLVLATCWLYSFGSLVVLSLVAVTYRRFWILKCKTDHEEVKQLHHRMSSISGVSASSLLM